jgi:DNA-binding CsgD family transcriptional regulator
MLSGVESLTPSEQRVANLAAAGQSNTEIAQALFITRKTVEKHLGNVYLKLGISSRERLPEQLGDRNLTPLSSFSTLPASIRQGAQT